MTNEHSTPTTHHRELVYDALAHEGTALSLNEIVACCGGPVSAASRSLVVLEREGRAQFANGRWSLRYRPSAFVALADVR